MKELKIKDSIYIQKRPRLQFDVYIQSMMIIVVDSQEKTRPRSSVHLSRLINSILCHAHTQFDECFRFQ